MVITDFMEYVHNGGTIFLGCSKEQSYYLSGLLQNHLNECMVELSGLQQGADNHDDLRKMLQVLVQAFLGKQFQLTVLIVDGDDLVEDNEQIDPTPKPGWVVASDDMGNEYAVYCPDPIEAMYEAYDNLEDLIQDTPNVIVPTGDSGATVRYGLPPVKKKKKKK